MILAHTYLQRALNLLPVAVTVNNKSIIVCLDESFILPIYVSAFSETVASKKIANRYIGAFVLNDEGKIFKIINVIPMLNAKRTFIDFLFGRYLIKVETVEVDVVFEQFLDMLIQAAINGDGYSVWAYFYNSADELRESLLKCKSFVDIQKTLNIGKEGYSSVLA